MISCHEKCISGLIELQLSCFQSFHRFVFELICHKKIYFHLKLLKIEQKLKILLSANSFLVMTD